MTEDNVVGPWVEWDVPGPPTRSRLVVDERIRKPYEPGDYRADMRPVTHDDLRKACAAVGLVVEDVARIESLGARMLAAEAAEQSEKARAEKAEGELATIRAATEPWTSMVGTEQICNALRGVYAPDGDWRKLLAELSDLRTKLAAAEERSRNLEHALVVQKDTTEQVRAKLAALTAPVEGEPTDLGMTALFASRPSGESACAFALRQWRMGHAACAARHQPTERPACLVERAVAGRLSVELMHDSAGYLAIVSPSIVGKTRSMGHIPASDVRATLEAMLTEVGA